MRSLCVTGLAVLVLAGPVIGQATNGQRVGLRGSIAGRVASSSRSFNWNATHSSSRWVEGALIGGVVGAAAIAWIYRYPDIQNRGHLVAEWAIIGAVTGALIGSYIHHKT